MNEGKITKILALSTTLSRVQGASRSLAGLPPCLVEHSEQAAALLDEAKLNLSTLAETLVAALQIETSDAVADESVEKRSSVLIGELLAFIHGDGGHHESEVGTEQAVEDAKWIVIDALRALEGERRKFLKDREPLDGAEQVWKN